ncbi:hypothetical protein [Streptomyces sp. NPDC057617]|uniref:hypothetical protein n=1 Tax=Streptomyces sp. NPDC057617 TaxID=3346184 RepID=UPI0036BC9C84
MTQTPNRLSEIARSLNCMQWLPTAEEVDFGNAFFQQVKKAEEELCGDFPRGMHRWHRLRTEDFTALARTVTVVKNELLPAWRDRLPASPMVELVEMYVSGAQPVLPHAETLLAAWHDATLAEPSDADIAYEARRLNISSEQAAANFRFWKASHWEKEHFPRSLEDDLRPVWGYLIAVGSTLTAAVTGDTDY